MQIGDRFKKWLVVGPRRNGRRWKPYWLCRCDCGTERYVSVASLQRGESTSCRCGKRIAIANTHGMSETPEHKAWNAMLRRCRNPRHPQFADYGGRGISVCQEWLDFQAFFRDMGLRPRNHSLDRIDNDGDYEPGNCRWATAIQQHRNTRSNHRLTFNGKTMTLVEWAAATGLGYETIRHRLLQGWTTEKALTMRTRPYGRGGKIRPGVPA